MIHVVCKDFQYTAAYFFCSKMAGPLGVFQLDADSSSEAGGDSWDQVDESADGAPPEDDDESELDLETLKELEEKVHKEWQKTFGRQWIKTVGILESLNEFAGSFSFCKLFLIDPR